MLRRTIGITATAAAISIAAILPAGASTAPGIGTYAAGAKATALDLSVFGKSFTIADTTTGIDSTPKAVANGLAVFTPLFSSSGAASATDGSSGAQDCAGLPIPVPSQLAADLVCITTTAKLLDGKPVSSSAANQITIEIKAPATTTGNPTIDQTLSQVVGGVQSGLGGLFTALVPLTGPIEAQAHTNLVESLQGIIDGLIGEIHAGDVLAQIIVAPSSSLSQLTGSGVSAQARSNGVIVSLLPNLPGGALAVATVGSASAGVVRDAVTGAATRSGEAALIDVTYPNDLLGGLEILGRAVAPEVTGTVLGAISTLTAQLPCGASNPLASVICFDVGAVTDFQGAVASKAMGFDYGESTVGRATSVLNLRLLSMANGGVILKVGSTSAAASALTGTIASAETPGPLPRTGADTAWPLTLALLGAGVAAATLLRRSRTI